MVDALRTPFVALGVCITMCFCSAVKAEFEYKIPMQQHDSGNYYLSARLNGVVQAEFLLDTGAGFVTINRDALRALKKERDIEKVNRVAMRMANGALQAVDVYRVDVLELGDGCDVGPIDVAVIPGSTRNILGINALAKAAPFAVYVSSPTLAVSACADLPVLSNNL